MSDHPFRFGLWLLRDPSPIPKLFRKYDGAHWWEVGILRPKFAYYVGIEPAASLREVSQRFSEFVDNLDGALPDWTYASPTFAHEPLPTFYFRDEVPAALFKMMMSSL